MKCFQILTDSTSDLEKGFREEFDIDYAKMTFMINGKEYKADLDWTEITAKEYYSAMREGKRSSTSLVSASEFETKFQEYLEKGFDVLYISCSSKLSGSINNAKIVAAELLDKYPKNKIICFDSLRSNYSQGLMAIEAAKMANEGKSIDEVVTALSSNRLKYQTYATIGSLEWLKKAGRVKSSIAFLGDLFGVKPIILADAVGNNYVYKKVKGRKQSLDELIEITVARLENPENASIYIEHADAPTDALYIAEELKKRIHPKRINISYIGPIIGATVGPDSITVNFYGEKVTIIG